MNRQPTPKNVPASGRNQSGLSLPVTCHRLANSLDGPSPLKRQSTLNKTSSLNWQGTKTSLLQLDIEWKVMIFVFYSLFSDT